MDGDHPDIVLANARVLTMDDSNPIAGAVGISGRRVSWVGSIEDAGDVVGGHTTVIDCGGGTVLPGFHDAHVHLLAYARALGSVDCRSSAVSSIEELKLAVAGRSSGTPEGEWIRAWGYDEFSLDENRHPSRWDLDIAAPRNPVRLTHRSGHATVLNSLGMDCVGITSSTPEPAGATIARDSDSGEPTGLLLEMEEFVERRIPHPSFAELARSVQSAATRLLSYGVTSIQDATHHNSMDRWRLFRRLREQVSPGPRITVMPGHRHVADFVDRGLSFGSGDRFLRLGHVKLMVTASGGVQFPTPCDVSEVIDRCQRLGYPVAVHAVEEEVVRGAAESLARRQDSAVNRIEHCSECPPGVLQSVAASGAAVVTNPGFIHTSGDRYLNTVPDSMRPNLYRIKSLVDQGIAVAFGSDAPFGDPNPMLAISTAVTRRTSSGAVLGVHESVDLAAAIRSYTKGSAIAAALGNRLGSLAPGQMADVIVFERDLTQIPAADLAAQSPRVTILDGSIAWRA